VDGDNGGEYGDVGDAGDTGDVGDESRLLTPNMITSESESVVVFSTS